MIERKTEEDFLVVSMLYSDWNELNYHSLLETKSSQIDLEISCFFF